MKWKSQTHSVFGNFSNLETFPGITTLFLKLTEDDNLTGLQTITKKAFHMLVSKRATNYCGTICHSKIWSLGELILFLVQMLKSFELTLFFQHTDWPQLGRAPNILWSFNCNVCQYPIFNVEQNSQSLFILINIINITWR